MMDPHFSSFVDEFCKLAARPVTREEAEKSLKKLKAMEEERDMPALARSAGVGAALMPVAGLASRLVAGTAGVMKGGKKFNVKQLGKSLKDVDVAGLGRKSLSDAMYGGIGGGLLPLAREGVERKAQEAKLKTFIEQSQGEKRRGLSRLRRAIAEQTGV